ncbi:MAG: rhodanese-like domain-containing protein [Alphaproteobacteria bacterium]|nr:rhodanese-like domain-containing protein [Alphaproteobacteria bacterium]
MIDQVQPAQWRDWMAQQAEQGAPLMLDVREDWEVQTASVRPDDFELVHIPMGQLVQRLSELNPERPLACLCHHGSRSMQVASYLTQRGFHKVANIAGGIHAWSAQVDPTVPLY